MPIVDLTQTLTSLIGELTRRREKLMALELLESGIEFGAGPVDVSAHLATIRAQVEILATKLKVPVVYKP